MVERQADDGRQFGRRSVFRLDAALLDAAACHLRAIISWMSLIAERLTAKIARNATTFLICIITVIGRYACRAEQS